MKPRPPALGFNCHRMTVTASLRLAGPARPGLSEQSAGASAAPSPSSGFPLFLLIVRNDSLLQTRSSSCVSDTEKYRLGAPDSDSDRVGLGKAWLETGSGRSAIRSCTQIRAQARRGPDGPGLPLPQPQLTRTRSRVAGSPGPSPSQAGTGILGGARSHLGSRAQCLVSFMLYEWYSR